MFLERKQIKNVLEKICLPKKLYHLFQVAVYIWWFHVFVDKDKK